MGLGDMIWWHMAFWIGDVEYVSFLVCQRVPIEVEQRKPEVEKEQFLLLECAGAARVKLCKAGSG